MKARLDSVLYDAVLSYCIDRTLSGYDQAMHYGRLSGFFTFENELTALGKSLRKVLKQGMKYKYFLRKANSQAFNKIKSHIN
jgi:hypothetical protein